MHYLFNLRLINVYFPSPDPNPRGGGQLPNPNECNATLTSGTENTYPTPIDVNDRVTGYEFARRCAEVNNCLLIIYCDVIKVTLCSILWYNLSINQEHAQS